VKVFSFFTEPASYTLDLIDNVHDIMSINYCFFNSHSEAYTSFKGKKNIFMDQMKIVDRIRYLLYVRRKYDAVIFNSYDTLSFFFIFLINVFSIKKIYIAIESDTQLLMPKNFLKRLLKYFYLSLIFQNNYVFGLAGGNYSHKDLFRYYGMKEDRIFLMPMMVDNSKFYTDKKKFPKPFTFLFVGRLLDTKNVDKLCQQFTSLFSNKKAKMIIVGDGGNLEKYKKNFSKKNIIFMGNVYNVELINIYKNATVFTFPSSLDAWGLVVNEALSAGLPVIARKEVGACSDLIKGKETGFIVENMQDFGQMMLTLFNDSELLNNYSKNASDLMKNNWNYMLYRQCMMEFINTLSK
jgi:glycosyltransferase involved in cell wall biosynthesis